MATSLSKEDAAADGGLLFLRVVGWQDVNSLAVRCLVYREELGSVVDPLKPLAHLFTFDPKKAVVI